jgi:hypothetical protein
MTSIVDVCNNALANIGTRSSISVLTEDSAEARACNLQFYTVLETLLRSAPWNFARKFVTMSLLKALPGTPENQTTPVDSLWHTTYPPPPWFYSYAYPSDCVLARYVLPQIYSANVGVPIFSAGNYTPMGVVSRPSRFAVELDTDSQGNDIRVICSNDQQAILCYTKLIDNPNLWDPIFYNAMQDALGAAITIPLTGNLNLAKMLYEQANGTITQARAMDGNEGLTTVDYLPDWLRARGGISQMNEDTGYYASWGPLFSMPGQV